ncbi:hypothetical protein Kpol_1009p15 [Vanderwaltozyma polyspora DSM 70294]|uniref:Uncharacterized protein n=1 Tax=Vanderwaltozyma polyspora (strain ATCC 22028 / DSM 70294 / BCRC 21397 / CBS 2163 / NBRC 10782 / NRRL Y-8283 / UCD 57-17) TaxID=436907 RepID=A7TPE1_VANPO|nr:uncharacterized protein Kpol_1009p15 [Vanderwaltozyma polyspora DSM 70294]EDO15869.1 hypothetical protein Kpol_1009p15 [Vanderwaltozyma polyspora DSM 70294]
MSETSGEPNGKIVATEGEVESQTNIDVSNAKQDNQKDDNKPVLPWENSSKDIQVKTFTGYTLNLKGWIRKDIKEKQSKEREEKRLEEAKKDEKSAENDESKKANGEEEKEQKDPVVEPESQENK